MKTKSLEKRDENASIFTLPTKKQNSQKKNVYNFFEVVFWPKKKMDDFSKKLNWNEKVHKIRSGFSPKHDLPVSISKFALCFFRLYFMPKTLILEYL